MTNSFLLVQGYENVFALGDVAAICNEEFPQGLPMVAQPAIQQGQYLANYFENLIDNKKQKLFIYKDKGSIATIGRNKAVVDINNKH